VTGGIAPRDGPEIEALITDGYLDALLAAHARGADAAPAEARPAPAIAAAADRLARDLPRLHPSFRFEEALAARLAEAASRMGLAQAAGSEGAIVPLPGRWAPLLGLPGSAGDPGVDGVPEDARPGLGRPLLIGGALTSAALSIAGAAYVAWRLNRLPSDPMGRAVRAVARARLA